MVTGLALQALGFTWVAARGSLAASWIELMLALLVAGIGISISSAVFSAHGHLGSPAAVTAGFARPCGHASSSPPSRR